MVYLDFVHIDQFGEHLKDNGITEVFVSSRHINSASGDIRFQRATFSARIGDYIALCTFGFHHDANLSGMEEMAEVKKQVEMLQDRLSRFGVSVKEGRWTGETPQALKDE